MIQHMAKMATAPRRSRIEVDPNAESGQEESVEVVEQKDVAIWRRFCVQMPVWREHLAFYILDYSLCLVIELLAISLAIGGFMDCNNRASYNCVASFLQPLAFLWIWFRTPEGPPFFGDKKGNKLEPKYKVPKLSFLPPIQAPADIPFPLLSSSSLSTV